MGCTAEDSTMQPVTPLVYIPKYYLRPPIMYIFKNTNRFLWFKKITFLKECLRLIHSEIVIELPAAHICQWFSTCSNTQ